MRLPCNVHVALVLSAVWATWVTKRCWGRWQHQRWSWCSVRSLARSCVDRSAEVAKAMLMALACVDWSSAAAKSRPIGSTPTCVPASPRWIPCAASPGLQDSDLSVQGGNRIVAKQRMTVRPRSAMTLALLRSQEQSKNALAYNQTANASWNRAAALKSIRKWRRHCHGSTLRVPVA